MCAVNPRGLLNDFKVFALSGNVMDLAIGVILGIAFKAVVDAFATNVLLQLIGAIFKFPDFSKKVVSLNGSDIQYGVFVSAVINFILISGSLLLVVKLLQRLGMNFRAQGNRECDYCKSFVPVDATKCMYCCSALDPVVAD